MMNIFGYLRKYLWTILFVSILIISTFIKGAEVVGGNFPFTTDQGRDMVDIRHMVVAHAPRLVGPTTSINGVLLGPFWYYFNLPPFIIGGGDPSYIVYWQILWYQISIITLWLVLKRKSISLATITAVLFFLMPTGFNTARYFWNANSMPFFTVFYFATLIWAIQSKSFRKLLLLGLISGLAMQIEAAFGILLFPFSLIYFLFCHSGLDPESIKIKFQRSIPLVIGFVLTLLPQALFELKHGFIMTKILIGEFAGKGDMLGEKITFSERLAQRWDHLSSLILRSSHLPPNYVPILYLLGLIVCLVIIFGLTKKIDKKANSVWSLSFYFLLFSAIFYVLFPQKLKIWYTLGLSIPLVIFLSSFFDFLYQRKNFIFKTASLLLICFTIYYSVKSQVDYTREVASKPSDDRSNMRNELTALDWVYQNAAGQGFKVYSYLPSVYDFPYNHLFWWYGNHKYGYEPFETAYLPNQPEYINDVDKIWMNKRIMGSNSLTFLIIEEDMDMPIRTEAWLGNFSKLCLIKEQVFPWHAKVQMRSACNK